MATNIRVIPAHEFIKATPEGYLNLEKTKEMLIEIASASSTLIDYEVIVDMRNVQDDLSITDLYYLVSELGKYRKTFSHKVAIVCPMEKFDHAGFFALCAANRGFQIKPFTSLGDAIEWLIGIEPAA